MVSGGFVLFLRCGMRGCFAGCRCVSSGDSGWDTNAVDKISSVQVQTLTSLVERVGCWWGKQGWVGLRYLIRWAHGLQDDLQL